MATEDPQTSRPKRTASQKAFQSATPEVRDLVKQILQKERQEMHKKRRPEIHATILETIKRVIQ